MIKLKSGGRGLLLAADQFGRWISSGGGDFGLLDNRDSLLFSYLSAFCYSCVK